MHLRLKIIYILLLVITIALIKLKPLTRLEIPNQIINGNGESSDEESVTEQIFFPEIFEQDDETPQILFNNNYIIIQNSDMFEMVRASTFSSEAINHLEGLWEHPHLPVTALTVNMALTILVPGVRTYFRYLITQNLINNNNLKIPIVESIQNFGGTLDGQILAAAAGLDGDLTSDKEQFVNSFLDGRYKTINVEKFLSAYSTSDLQRLDVVTTMLLRAYASPNVSVEVNPLNIVTTMVFFSLGWPDHELMFNMVPILENLDTNIKINMLTRQGVSLNVLNSFNSRAYSYEDRMTEKLEEEENNND